VFQLTYISTAVAGLTDREIENILAISRRNNARDGITGLLVHDDIRFLQALEGEQVVVEAAFRRIKADPRHRAAVMLSEREVAAKQFGAWSMACQRGGGSAGRLSLPQIVDTLVSAVPDPNIRALFSSFVRLDRERAA
jgi:hypothetical protein